MKLSSLIAVRQIYKLGRNCYELIYEPELTLRELVDDFDKSQMFLLILTALTPLFVYIVLRVIWDLVVYGNVAAIFGSGLNFVLFVEALIFAYLGYFLIKILKK